MNKEYSLKTFGNNVRVERLKKKLSQEKLAEIVNLSTVYISNIENGKQNVSLKIAHKFSVLFNKSIDYLLSKH